MRATEVKFERLAVVSGTRFDNVKIGVNILLAEGETAEQGLAMARNFVETNLRLAGAVIVEDAT